MGTKGILGRAVLLFIIDCILLIAVAVWFDYLGIWDVKAIASPVYNLFGAPVRNPQRPSDSLLLLEEERLQKQIDSLDLRNMEIDKRESDLSKRENEVSQKIQEIEARQKALDDQEVSFVGKEKEFEDRKANIDQNARYVMGMDPKKAVPILLAMDDQNVIDIFRMVEQISKSNGEDSIVPFWLSLMPPDRAATLQRKMTAKPLSLQ